MAKIIKNFTLLCTGGLGYGLIELMWRGGTHISMFFAGGICFFIIVSLDEFEYKPSLWTQAVLSGALITAVEFLSGLLVNLLLGLDVWDYSGLPMNVMGQICLPFSALWVLLSVPAIYLEDYLRHVLFLEPMKKQRLLPAIPGKIKSAQSR